MNISTKSATKPTVASLISERQSILNVTDEQLAMAVGFESANVVVMIKIGKTRMPITRVAAYAAALSIDPAFLLRIALAEYSPETLAVVDALFTQKLLTSNEEKLIEDYRFLAKGRDATPMILDGTNILALLSI